jgi:hypothetical protein
MKNDEITKMQMSHFCDQVRAAVSAERAVIVTTVEGHTNLSASLDEDQSGGEEEVLANIVTDLARAIVSVHPSFTLTLSSPGNEPLVINGENSGMQVTQRILDMELVDGNVG